LWARSKGLPATSVAELAEDPVLRAEIDAAVAAANSRLSRPEQVKTYRILARG
jgi:long-chain acyl-CoA synthetase